MREGAKYNKKLRERNTGNFIKYGIFIYTAVMDLPLLTSKLSIVANTLKKSNNWTFYNFFLFFLTDKVKLSLENV